MDEPLKIRLLGAPQIHVGHSPVTGFITRKAEALFFYLAATRRTHTRDALATLFWANEDLPRALKNLRGILPNLRSLVGDYLLITRNTIAFDTTRSYWLDTEMLQARFAQIGPTTNVEELRAAIESYRGEFLEGYHVRGAPNFEEWSVLEREHLHELYIQGLQTLAARYIDLQEYRTALVVTQRILAIEPWQEGAHRQQMICLAGSGRAHEAVEQYAICRQILADELGLEPLAETTALYEQLHAGVAVISPQSERPIAIATNAPASYAPALHPTCPVTLPPHHLPRQLTRFFGRTLEITAICAKLQQPECAWLTLIGVGGVGKTRLALKVGETLLPYFRDGVRFVSLLEIVPGEEVVEQFVAAIGKALQIPFTGAESLAPQLEEYLRDKHLLLILDNFEQLNLGQHDNTSASYVYNLLQAARQVKVLITSRHRLNTQAEHLFIVDGLPLPDTDDSPRRAGHQPATQLLDYDSIALFVQRAGHSVTDFTLDEANAAAIIRICELVEGLPLGIELAATLVQRYTCTQIAALLEDHYDSLASTFHDLPLRHRTLQATLAYSWQLLTPKEAAILAQCAVFHDSFTAAAATAVTGATTAQLQHLEDQMLLQPMGAKRLTMHRLMHQYAMQQLRSTPALEQEARKRHCLYFSQFLQRLEEAAQPDVQLFESIHAEMANIYAGWEWAVEQGKFALLRQLLPPLVHLYTSSGSHREIATILSQSVANLYKRFVTQLDTTPELQQLVAQMLLEQAYFYITTARVEQAKPLIQQALHLADGLDNPTLTTTAYWRLGDAAWAQGDYAGHRTAYEQALALAQTDGRRQSEIHSLSNLGMNYDMQGEYNRAIPCYEAALALTRQLGDREKENVIYNNLGVSNALLGNFTQALAYYQETLQISRQLGDQEGSGFANLNFGLLYNRLGEWERAKYYGERALKIFRMINDRRLEARTLAQLSFSLHYLAEETIAAGYCRQALHLARNGGYQAVQAEALTVWGQLLLDRQQGAKAVASYREAAKLWQTLKRPQRLLVAQAGLAESLRLLDDHAGALRVVEEILALLADSSLQETMIAGQVHLTCYHTLATHDDARATLVLQNAYQLLQAKAAKIQSEELRSSFLQRIDAHKAIIELAQTQPSLYHF